MRLRFLLVNPWIHDFSALNLWSLPAGLLRLGEFLSQYNVDLEFIDCLKIHKERPYGTGKYLRQEIKKPEVLKNISRRFARYGMTPAEFIERLKGIKPPDAIFVTSMMTYWYTGVRETVEHIKMVFPDTPVILGGIYATLVPEHAIKNTGADLVYRGEASNGILASLRTFGFRLKKVRERLPYYRLFTHRWRFASITTSSGCIYSCPYCASKILNKEFIQRDPDDIVKEIYELYLNGITDFAFYDDALLVNPETHIKYILKEIIKKNIQVRFHTPNGLHARFIDDELASLMKKAGFRTIRLGLETLSPERQKTTGNKITNPEFINSINSLKKAGFTKREIGVYIMYGLPEQGLDEVEEGVRFLMDMDLRIYLTEFSPIPGTIYWQQLIKKGIINESMDLLHTNNTVYSLLYCNYAHERLKRLKLLVKEYNER